MNSFTSSLWHWLKCWFHVQETLTKKLCCLVLLFLQIQTSRTALDSYSIQIFMNRTGNSDTGADQFLFMNFFLFLFFYISTNGTSFDNMTWIGLKPRGNETCEMLLMSKLWQDWSHWWLPEPDSHVVPIQAKSVWQDPTPWHWNNLWFSKLFFAHSETSFLLLGNFHFTVFLLGCLFNRHLVSALSLDCGLNYINF